MNKKYKYYAVYKNASNDGKHYDGRKTAQEAKDDLERLMERYLTNDIIFMGIIKCADDNPWNHIPDLN